jgi:hypothetical protein
MTYQQFFDDIVAKGRMLTGCPVPIMADDIPEDNKAISATYFRFDKGIKKHVAAKIVINQKLVAGIYQEFGEDAQSELLKIVAHEIAHSSNLYSQEAKSKHPKQAFVSLTTMEHMESETDCPPTAPWKP